MEHKDSEAVEPTSATCVCRNNSNRFPCLPLKEVAKTPTGRRAENSGLKGLNVVLANLAMKKLDTPSLRNHNLCYGCTAPTKRGKETRNSSSTRSSVFCHPLWKNDLICALCARDRPRCVICERPSRAKNSSFLTVAARKGRETFYMCHLCLEAGIATGTNDLKSIIEKAVYILRQDSVIQIEILKFFNISTDIPAATKKSQIEEKPLLMIRFSELHDLNSIVLSPRQKSVSSWSEDLVFGRFHIDRISPNTSEIYVIDLCRRLQVDFLVSILAHEMVHAVIALKGIRLELEMEEALCNSVTLQALIHIAMSLKSGDKTTKSISTSDVLTLNAVNSDTMNQCSVHTNEGFCGNPFQCAAAEGIGFGMLKQMGIVRANRRSQLRRELCLFRCRRLLLCDTAGTRRLHDAVEALYGVTTLRDILFKTKRC